MILLYSFKYLLELNKYMCPLGKHADGFAVYYHIIHMKKISVQFLI